PRARASAPRCWRRWEARGCCGSRERMVRGETWDDPRGRREKVEEGRGANLLPSPFFPLGLPLLEFPAQPFFLFAQLRRHHLVEVLGLEDLANLDFGAAIEGRLLQPLDGFLHRSGLPDPEACDQLLALRERTVDDGALAALEAHARSA